MIRGQPSGFLQIVCGFKSNFEVILNFRKMCRRNWSVRTSLYDESRGVAVLVDEELEVVVVSGELTQSS